MNIGGASGGSTPGNFDMSQVNSQPKGDEQECDAAKGEEENAGIGKKGEKSMAGAVDAKSQSDMVSLRLGADQMQANSSQITF